VTSLSRAERLVVAVAAFGFFFDAYELLTLPLIVGPAFDELAGGALSPAFNVFGVDIAWAGLIFWAPAVCGGLFGLAGGHLADRFGRRSVLVWSILIYAGASLAAGFSTTALMFLVCRCLIMIGVCVEFVAGIAWLAETFSDPKRREAAVGFAQAVAGFGGLAVTGVWKLIIHYANSLPVIAGGHEEWRYLCLSGLLPALPLILIRPFMKESPMWVKGQMRQRPPVAALFDGSMRRTTVAAIIATACTYALAYGAMQHLPRFVKTMPEVTVLIPSEQNDAAGNMQMIQESGGLVGRMMLAWLVVAVIARRRMLRVLQLAALVAFPLTFIWLSGVGFTPLGAGVFLTAAITAAQFNFWGSYLPRVFPTHLRGTGEGFAANVGGRIIGTTAALATTTIAASLKPEIGAGPALAVAAGAVATLACAIGLFASRFLAEPASEHLPH
jgi:MFS family permease